MTVPNETGGNGHVSQTAPDRALGADATPEPVFLVYGRSGWIGGLVGDILKAQGA